MLLVMLISNVTSGLTLETSQLCMRVCRPRNSSRNTTGRVSLRFCFGAHMRISCYCLQRFVGVCARPFARVLSFRIDAFKSVLPMAARAKRKNAAVAAVLPIAPDPARSTQNQSNALVAVGVCVCVCAGKI